jgi:ATP-dependent DNA ligase
MEPTDDEVQLYTFDILALDGDDLRMLPLFLRKTNLARLLARRPQGIFVSPSEQGRSGRSSSGRPASSDLRAWSQAPRRTYRSGRSPNWIKVKTVPIRRWIGSGSRSDQSQRRRRWRRRSIRCAGGRTRAKNNFDAPR